MQTGYWIVIGLYLFTLTIEAGSISELDIKLKEHINRTAKFPCGLPQLRSYNIKNHLIAGALNTSQNVFPPFTVIHRCDSGTGCCGSTRICAPKTKTEISVAVKVTTQVKKIEESIRMLKVENHTSCECSESQVEVPPPVMILEQQ